MLGTRLNWNTSPSNLPCGRAHLPQNGTAGFDPQPNEKRKLPAVSRSAPEARPPLGHVAEQLKGLPHQAEGLLRAALVLAELPFGHGSKMGTQNGTLVNGTKD